MGTCVECGNAEGKRRVCHGDGRLHHHGMAHTASGKLGLLCDLCYDNDKHDWERKRSASTRRALEGEEAMTTETKTQHTQGPWHTEPEEWTGGESIVICAPSRTIIAVVTGTDDDPTTAADARAIAAVPDLIAALRETVAFLRQLPREDAEEWPDLNGIIQHADAALAKVEGA